MIRSLTDLAAFIGRVSPTSRRRLARVFQQLRGRGRKRSLDLSGADMPAGMAFDALADGRAVLMDLDPALLRGLGPLAAPLEADGWHPFVATLRAYRAGMLTGYEGSPLEHYYSGFRPQTVADVSGVPGARGANPALEFVLPWSDVSPEAAHRRRIADMARENAENGGPATGWHGWTEWGPVTPEKGQTEFRRLVATHDSLAALGYRPSQFGGGHIRAQFLRDGPREAFLIYSGQHRAAALVALGHSRIPVLIENPPVDKRQVAEWPAVRRAIYSPEHAVALFDRMMAGQPPALARGAV